MRVLTSTNPATEEVIASYTCWDATKIDSALERAAIAFEQFARLPLEERMTMLSKAAEQLRTERDSLALLATTEMGRPLPEAEAEIEKSALCFEYYATCSASHLAVEPTPSDSTRSYVCHEPYGVVLAITPWNLPFWQVFRFAAPCLAGGNAVLLKHAPNVTGCALAIEKLLERAGFPSGLFQSLVIDVEAVEAVIADPRVNLVTFTGSDRAGSAVAALAGRHIKKTIMELGGSDSLIVLDDADVDAAAAAAASSRFMNAGQTCLAAKRMLVMDAIADRFEDALVAHTKQIKLGNPLNRTTTMGPLARADLRSNLERQIEASMNDGARILYRHPNVEGPGFFHPPVVLSNCGPDVMAFREETFGPVAAVMRVRSAEHAIEVANGSPYGLCASLWSTDITRSENLARRLQVGGVFINGFTRSHPNIPFGGAKRSGYGRDLGRFALSEFTQPKTIWISDTLRTGDGR